jgi:hypothetical protein
LITVLMLMGVSCLPVYWCNALRLLHPACLVIVDGGW